MDVTILSEKSLKIKGKVSTIIVDPVSTITNIEAEGILYSHPKDKDVNESRVENSRISIKGAGEYEVGGIKINALKVNGGLVSLVDVENVKILIGSGNEILKVHEKIEAYHILLINADNEFDYSSLTKLDPKVLLVYGDKREEVKKALGKDDAEKGNKYTITFEKLPSEMHLKVLEK